MEHYRTCNNKKLQHTYQNPLGMGYDECTTTKHSTTICSSAVLLGTSKLPYDIPSCLSIPS
jgi:hypothetical protein